jgi:hypothetical protein
VTGQDALLADAVGPALLIVLETLDPAERLALLWHCAGGRLAETAREVLLATLGHSLLAGQRAMEGGCRDGVC